MNIDEDGGGQDRLAIAQQVIKSAGDVLRAAGFARDEIESFFRQAADQLSGDAARRRGTEGLADAATGAELAPRLQAEFAGSPPAREMAQLHAHFRRLGLPGRGEAPLAEHFDLAMKVIPLIAEAQNGVRELARKAGLAVFADRRDAAAPGDGALYLDDFSAAWSHGFELIGALIVALTERGDEAAFAFLLESLLENGVIISFELKQIIERATMAFTPQPEGG